jgi:hypothetical protein
MRVRYPEETRIDMAVRLEIPGGRSITLKERTTIGRDTDCDIPVLDPLVAHVHAEIRKLPDGQFMLVDLGSPSGTFVSGERVAEYILSDGDEISLGRTRMTYREAAGTPRPSAAGEEQPKPLYLQSFPKIESVWQTGEEFLQSYKASGQAGRFFHPFGENEDLPPDARVGVLLSVNLRFLDRQAEFHIHAKIVERLTAGENRGLRLEFLPEEKERQELVMACAGGATFPYFRRRYERTSCRLPVRVVMEGNKQLDSMAIEISEGGVGLVPNHTLRTEMNVRLAIFFPGTKRPLTIRGRVAAVIPEGPRQGVGVEFLFDSPAQRDEVKYQVSMIRSRWSD